MAQDKHERSYQRKAGAKALATPKKATEPFVMIPAEVLKSDAYKSLGYSARAMLIELIHFYYGGNNGTLWIAPEMLNERGFSRNTAARSFKELLIHGFIFMTRKGGNQKGGCSWFALTWLPLNKSEGMILDCYHPKKFLKYTPKEKNRGPKLGSSCTQIGDSKKAKLLKGNKEESIGNTFHPLNSYSAVPNLVTYKDIANKRGGINQEQVERTNSSNWMAQDQKRLSKIALNGLQCYQIPTIH